MTTEKMNQLKGEPIFKPSLEKVVAYFSLGILFLYCMLYLYNFATNTTDENLIMAVFRLPIAIVALVMLYKIDMTADEYILKKNSYSLMELLFFCFILYVTIDLISIFASMNGKIELSNSIYSKRFWILGTVVAVLYLGVFLQKCILNWEGISKEYNQRIKVDTIADILNLEMTIEDDLEEINDLMNQHLKKNKSLILKKLNTIQAKQKKIANLKRDLKRIKSKIPK
jgi:hypothetical protein